MTPTLTPSLNERLGEAQREADELRTELERAEADLRRALEDGDEARAETLRQAADEVRQPVLIAEAHVKALSEGVQELDRHRAEEQRAELERRRLEQAEVQYQAARAAEAEAMDEMERHLAELPAAYGALREAMEVAVRAEQRITQARNDVRTSGIAAGHFDPDTPPYPPYANASVQIQISPLLNAIWRHPRLI